MIEQGGVKLNGEKVADRGLKLTAGAEAVLQVGNGSLRGSNRLIARLAPQRLQPCIAPTPGTIELVAHGILLVEVLVIFLGRGEL